MCIVFGAQKMDFGFPLEMLSGQPFEFRRPASKDTPAVVKLSTVASRTDNADSTVRVSRHRHTLRSSAGSLGCCTRYSSHAGLPYSVESVKIQPLEVPSHVRQSGNICHDGRGHTLWPILTRAMSLRGT